MINGFHFTKSIIESIQSWVKFDPSISRRDISRRLCGENDWRSPNGNLKDMGCRKALAELERKELVTLPTINTTFAFQDPSDPVEIEVAQITCSLQELGVVTVIPVDSRYAEAHRMWRSLLDTYHYLGSGPLCGAQIKYLVESPVYGVIGALAFTSASFALQARDKHIGWTEAARRANLLQVVCNARFLIPSSVKVPHLASHVLSLALSRLADDWEERYAVRPLLVETFVDPSRFSGTCYKAANWEEIGLTAGRRDGVKKRIFLYPLCADWRQKLCQAPPVQLGELLRPEEPAHWAEEEFGTVRFFDERLKQRLYVLAQNFYDNSEANIPEACGSKARTMAAYRFFNNKAVNMDVLLTPHTEATIERIKEHAVVLAPQDTTTLDYNTHPMTHDLGPTGSSGEGLGMLLHDTLAFTPEGTPLGILDAQCWVRDPQETDKSEKRKQLPIEEKESMKWVRSYRKVAEVQKLCPNTKIVSMGDRESDIYELFLEATKDPLGPGLLIRSDRARLRKVDEEEQRYLWDFMATREMTAKLKIHIPHAGSRKARDTWVELRFSKVEVRPPKRKKNDPPIPLWAVYLMEPSTGDESVTPIEWLLLTTVPVETVEDAQIRVEWYTGRWGIEVYHRTLKRGCRIRNRQLGTADGLQACIGIDMVVAWRIYHLTMLGRETPDVACTAFFSDVEWKTLCCLVTKNPIPPAKPPTMAEAVLMLGQLGGHLGRKSDGMPGSQVLWRGLQHLDNSVEAVELFGLFSRAP